MNRVAEDLCIRTFAYPGRKILRSKKALLTPDPLSRHILVAFRDGQRTRVGFAQKFKFEFKFPPCSPRDQRMRVECRESEVKKDLTLLVKGQCRRDIAREKKFLR